MVEQQSQVALVPDFCDVLLKKGDVSLRHHIEAVISDPQCWAEMKPYFINGGVCGHKMMDIAHTVDILRKYDKAKHAARLDSFRVNDFKLCNVLKSVVRSRYELDKYWKITGINLRRAVGVSKT